MTKFETAACNNLYIKIFSCPVQYLLNVMFAKEFRSVSAIYQLQ